ncbi:MAG: hypothetical protein ABFR97_03510 [Thermodesulfobacteriota bacterium]
MSAGIAITKDAPMDIDHIFQTALQPRAEAAVDPKRWKVLMRMANKVIRFSLTAEECREPRTISWLNSSAKRHPAQNYQPMFTGYRQLRDVDIIMGDKKIISYANYYLNLDDVIFAQDEFHTMGDNNRARTMGTRRITPDGVEIITKSIGDTIYHLNGHVYKLNASLSQNQFIPMTNVLIKKLDDSLNDAPPKAATQYTPFLALNRDYIEGFSVIFEGSRGF